jgi:hypothetical protein
MKWMLKCEAAASVTNIHTVQSLAECSHLPAGKPTYLSASYRILQLEMNKLVLLHKN